MRRMDDIGLDHEVLIDEVSAIQVVGLNASNLGGGDEDRKSFKNLKSYKRRKRWL